MSWPNGKHENCRHFFHLFFFFSILVKHVHSFSVQRMTFLMGWEIFQRKESFGKNETDLFWFKILKNEPKKMQNFKKWSKKRCESSENEAESIRKFWEMNQELQNLSIPWSSCISSHEHHRMRWRELNGNENVSSDNFLINYDLSSDNKLLLRSHNRIQYVFIHTSTTFSSINERWWSAFLSFRLLILAQPSMKDWGISWKP